LRPSFAISIRIGLPPPTSVRAGSVTVPLRASPTRWPACPAPKPVPFENAPAGFSDSKLGSDASARIRGEILHSFVARSERQVATCRNKRTVRRQSPPMRWLACPVPNTLCLSKIHQQASTGQSEAHQDANAKSRAEIERLREESRSPQSYVSARKWPKHRCAFWTEECQIVPDKYATWHC
jgi:hypothetical protein